MNVLASSFADPADVVAFKKAKAQGKTDKQAFAVGDNGIGCWGDETTQDHTPMCAVPPDDMIAKWGSIAKAKHREIIVTSRKTGKSVVCILADRMPYKKNIKNGCGIDLNPAAAVCLNLKPPFQHPVTWIWRGARQCTC